MLMRLLWLVLPGLAAAVPSVQQYHIHELALDGIADGNPFMEEVDAVFALGETEVIVPGFYDGDLTWKVRFSPSTVGTFSWKTVSSNPSLHGKQGSFRSVANTNPKNHGGLEIYDKYHFRFADGTPHMLMGYEADWLWAIGLNGSKSELKLDDFVGKIVDAGGFNHWLVNVYAKQASWSNAVSPPLKVSPTALTPWQGGVDLTQKSFDCSPSDVKSNLDCKDEDLTNGHHKTNSTDECCALCSDRTDCATWTLYPARSDCFLKSACSNPLEKSDCVSGGSTAPAPPTPAPSPPAPSPPAPSPAGQSMMDLDFWAHWDEVMQVLASHGAVAHVMVMVENKGVKWPTQGSAEDNLF